MRTHIEYKVKKQEKFIKPKINQNNIKGDADKIADSPVSESLWFGINY